MKTIPHEDLKDFSFLPPRIVIYDILPFHLLELDNSSPEFLLHGYFKKDKIFRNVWFLFLSISASNNETNSKTISTCIDFVKVRHLELINPSNQLLLKLKESSTINLHSFKLKTRLSNRKYVENLFSYKPEFKLRSLNLNFKSINVEMVFHHWNLRIWDDIESFGLSNNSICSSVIFDRMDQLVKLKKIKLIGIKISEERVCNFPLIEHIYIRSCLNLKIEPGGNVKSLFVSEIQPKYILNIYEKSPKMESLRIIGFESHVRVDYDWLLNKTINELTKLRSISLESIIEEVCPQDSDLHFFPPFVERIELATLWKFDGNYLFLKPIECFPRLRHLSFHALYHFQYSGKIWPLTSFLKTLEIHNVDGITDEFFSVNDFGCLEELRIVRSRSMRGEKWSGFPKLRVMKLSFMGLLRDSVFQRLHFENLEILELLNNNRLKGDNWNKFPSLKSFKFGEKDKIGKNDFWKNWIPAEVHKKRETFQ